MKYNTMIWDWNGTILNDAQLALDAVNEMLRKRNLAAINMEQYQDAMDTPIIKFYEKFFDMNQITFDEIAKEFHTYCNEHVDEYGLASGAKELLWELRKKGCRQMMLSSSKTEIIKFYTEKYQITEYFDEILGADNLFAESKVGRAKQYFKEHEISRERTVLIGDTLHDYEVASALGIDCLLLTCGHQGRKAFEGCHAVICDSFKDIYTAILDS